MKRIRIQIVVVVVIIALLLITVYSASARGRANPGVLPPNSRVQGLTYGEWSAKWWQGLLSIPAPQNPAFGAPWTDCFFERVGNIGLGVAFFSPSGTFTCEMPSGMMLFIPVVTTECSTLEPPPFYGGNEEELRACASGFILSDLQASIDGITIQNLSDYIVTSPLFEFTVPEDNILGVDAGTGQSVAHGAWLMLKPLTPGEHTIYVHSSLPDFDVTFDWYYDITVTRSR